ncbi:hypothetical protein LEM8419_03367 [Neolewinella maritima]|uniref:Anti-sigma factor n=1 Tax=Neolewinella maritima TaxID=1383882 RepID=A0ABM9B594_9BACT|nr:hypothetical protein [Neolewinella maritima]CAH1002488.1 hypothetical protein LEM8419_03367 [Neolewinella maritima]
MHTDKLQDYIQDHRADFDDATPPAGLWDRVEAALSAGDADETVTTDPLESFVAEHREAFDDATPSLQFDQVIALPTKSGPALKVTHRRRRTFLYLMAIAASLLLMFTAYRFGNRAGYRAGQEQTVAQQLERLHPELAEAERFYQQRIDAELTKVDLVNDDPQLRRDLRELDAATAEIRNQLLEVPESQRPMLVNQLIEAHRTKLDILLRIQQHFPQSNSPGAPWPRSNTSTHES